MHEMNKMNEMIETNERNETNETNCMTEVNEMKEMNEMTEMHEMNETDETNKSNEMNDMNEMNEMNGMNEMNEMTAMNEKTEMNEIKDQTRGPHFVRACSIETHVKISQEPLHTENYRKNTQKADTHTHTVREPAQSKRMSRFYTRRFIRKLTGNRPQKRVTTLIKHQPSHLPSEPLSVDTLFGEECFYILAAK